LPFLALGLPSIYAGNSHTLNEGGVWGVFWGCFGGLAIGEVHQTEPQWLLVGSHGCPGPLPNPPVCRLC